MKRALRLLSLVVVLAASRLSGQAADGVTLRHDATLQGTAPVDVRRATWRHVTVHYGKWTAAAVAVTFTALGAHEHQNSNRVFRQLLDFCRADNAACTLAPNGTYRNLDAEQLYQTSIHYDGRARLRLVLGQLSLLTSAGLFLADLTHHTSEPGNIPFHGAKLTVQAGGDASRVGVRIRF
jgi:hypothetical protein